MRMLEKKVEIEKTTEKYEQMEAKCMYYSNKIYIFYMIHLASTQHDKILKYFFFTYLFNKWLLHFFLFNFIVIFRYAKIVFQFSLLD